MQHPASTKHLRGPYCRRWYNKKEYKDLGRLNKKVTKKKQESRKMHDNEKEEKQVR